MASHGHKCLSRYFKCESAHELEFSRNR
jgi:hypothetical protein